MRADLAQLEQGEALALRFHPLTDQADLVGASLSNLSSSAAIGAALAAAVLLFFLRSLASIAVIALAVPLSIAGAWVIMRPRRDSLNMMSLGGLALAVGMLVDNAIVVLENIFRHRQLGKAAVRRLRRAAARSPAHRRLHPDDPGRLRPHLFRQKPGGRSLSRHWDRRGRVAPGLGGRGADGGAAGRRLGLPGLVDVHVHVMPPRLLDKVWAYFDAAGPLLGRRWPIEYRWPQERRLQHLRDLGVRAFPTLLYAHKPQMASSLNDWARDFAREQREAGHRDVLQTRHVPARAGRGGLRRARDRRGRPRVQGARAGRRLRPPRPAAGPGLGDARRRRCARRGAHRQRAHGRAPSPAPARSARCWPATRG